MNACVYTMDFAPGVYTQLNSAYNYYKYMNEYTELFIIRLFSDVMSKGDLNFPH